ALMARPRDDCTAMRARLDEPACRELADCFADRRARDPEAARKIHFVERLTGCERPAHDVVRELCPQFLGAGFAQWRTAQHIMVTDQQGHDVASAGLSMKLTCAATTCQPSAKRTQVCICRPILPGTDARSNRVEATAKLRP